MVVPDVVQEVNVEDMSAQHLERGTAVRVDLGDKPCEGVEGMVDMSHEEHSMEREDKKGDNMADEGNERALVVEAE